MSWRWWEQEGLDLEGEKKRSTAELDAEDAQCQEGEDKEETTGQD